MASANTRATRSRFSSPQQPAQNTPNESTRASENKKQTTLREWFEPPVQSRPSYLDAGLMPHGVLTGMAPLGTLPKAASVKKAAGGGDKEHTPIRKIILKQRSSAAAKPAPSTPQPEAPEDTIPAPTRRSTSSKAVDDDYDPRPKAATHSAPTRVKLNRRSLSRPGASRTSSAPPQEAPASTSPAPPPRPAKMPQDRETIEKVVENAVNEALEHFRYPTAFALRTLYDENASNPHFLAMVEEVFQQTADAETLAEFAKLMHDKKKEGKKDDKGCYYFVPPSTNSRFTPRKPVPAPYGSLVKLELPKLGLEGDGHLRKKAKPNNFHESARKAAANGVDGGGAKNPSPLRHRKRAESAGSTSSLSSAKSVSPPAEGAEEDPEEGDDVFAVPAGPGRDSPAGRAAASSASGPATRQPIAARKRHVTTTKKHGNVSPTSTPTPDSPPADLAPSTSGAGAASSMPAIIDPPLLPKDKRQNGGQTDSLVKFPGRYDPIPENDPQLRLKRDAKRVTESRVSVPMSWERPRAPERQPGPERDGRESSAHVRRRASMPPAATPLSTARATRSQKRTYDEAEGDASPTASHFPAESGGPPSGANSRAATPNPRAAKKPRIGLRVKMSPMKKKTGPSAGIPRAPGERGSPPANGQAHNQDENDDYCSSCGGNGELVCCDGCTRSFHFGCVDPPMEEGRLPDEWYCCVCFSARYPARVTEQAGPFAPLLGVLAKKNSSAFRLPADIRDYFEGVKTGADGEYEEIVPPTKARKKGGAEEVLDFFKLREADGSPVVCHRCQRSAAKDRAIIPCSLCGLYWHFDCLDPPAAHAPVPRTFRCPCHVDDLLARLPGALGPAHRFRKIKGAPAIQPAFGRGNANNGWIDVEVDFSDDESGWKQVESFGRTYTLPAKGIKLDFLSRRHASRDAEAEPTPRPASAAPEPATSRPAPVSVPRSTQDWERQQAALNLVRFSQGGEPGVDQLITTLVDNADPAVVSMIARGDAERFAEGALSAMDRQSLLAMSQQLEVMQAKLKARLESAPSPEAESSSVEAAEAAGDETAEAAKSPSPAPEAMQTSNAPPEEVQVPSPAAEDDATEVAESVPGTESAGDGTKEADQSDTTVVAADMTAAPENPTQTEGEEAVQGGKPVPNGVGHSEGGDSPNATEEADCSRDASAAAESAPDPKVSAKFVDAAKTDAASKTTGTLPEAMDLDNDPSQLPTP